MAKIMDPIMAVVSILGYWSIILGSFGGPGKSKASDIRRLTSTLTGMRTTIAMAICYLCLPLDLQVVDSCS